MEYQFEENESNDLIEPNEPEPSNEKQTDLFVDSSLQKFRSITSQSKPQKETPPKKKFDILLNKFEKNSNERTKLLQQLVNKDSAIKSDLDHFFNSICETVKTFKKKKQIEVKMKISNLVGQIELEVEENKGEYNWNIPNIPTNDPTRIKIPSSNTEAFNIDESLNKQNQVKSVDDYTNYYYTEESMDESNEYDNIIEEDNDPEYIL